MSLRDAAFSATRWTSTATMLRALLQVAQTMALARLLAPLDFGLIAMAGPIIAIAALLSDLGLSGALMHFPRPDRLTLSTIYWLNLAASCGLTAVVVLSSWLVAAAFGQAELLPVLCLLSLAFPLGALGQPFRTIAQKELQFSELAVQEIGTALMGFLVALGIAISGGGVYALVAGTLTTAATSSAFAWLRLSAGLRPAAEFSLDSARPFVFFGLHGLAGNLWNTLRMQADILIAALHASPAATALYSVPREQCLRLANTLINPVATRVGLPVMTRLQHDPTSLRSVYLQTLRMTASVNFPFYLLLAAFPDQIIALLLGDQWQGAGLYLRLFALWGLIRSTGNPAGSLLSAVGQVRRAHAWNAVQLVVTIPSLWISTAYWGLPALAGTTCVLQALSYVLAWRFLVKPACGAGFSEYNAQFAPPLLAAIPSCALARIVAENLPEAWQLPVGALLAGTGYVLLSWWLNRRWMRVVLELGRPLWSSTFGKS